MKTIRTIGIKKILGIMVLAIVFGCNKDNEDLVPWEIEVSQLKAATIKYQDVDLATAEGFFDASGFVPNMGHHYILPSRIDETFELNKPEILLYVPNPDSGMELVAVEYAIPIEDMENPGLPPEGFTGKDDVWEINPNLEQWQLHVWIFRENPEGIFKPHNPAVGSGN